jgi:N-acetyl-S-(2-succino)cysteine monooxygenase
MANKMHLGTIVLATGHHVSGWRMPDAEFGSENFDLINRIVQTAERGKFDFVFFADGVDTTPDAHPGMLVRFEPMTLLGALSMTTRQIGLVATVSTTYSQPYNVARALGTVDKLSKGRVGWNVVTSSSPNAALNFGGDIHPDPSVRYERAAEYLEVTKGLWNSWEDDALIGNKDTGVYMDPEKLHILNHSGKFYQVRGPLNQSRPPQGYPVIFQAGASDKGKDFAASSAEVIFATQQFVEDGIAFKQEIASRCEKAGRPRDSIKVMLGVAPILAESFEDAKRKIAALAEMLDPAAAMRILADRIGHDILNHPLDEPVRDDTGPALTQGHATALKAVAKKYKMTLRELRDYAAVSSGHRLVIGTAEHIADDLQMWFEQGASDGFVVMPPYHPGPSTEFVDEVVPLLVKRGLFRSDYEGTTLRDHLGLSRPAHPAVKV